MTKINGKDSSVTLLPGSPPSDTVPQGERRVTCGTTGGANSRPNQVRSLTYISRHHMSSRVFILSILSVSFAWFLLFSGATDLSAQLVTNHFWSGMAGVCVLMVLFVVRTHGSAVRSLLRIPRDAAAHVVGSGLVHGVLWAALSVIGLLLLRAHVPLLGSYAERIFAVSSQVHVSISALLLILLIAPAEEMYWRGYVMDVMTDRVGSARAPLAMAALDAAVHAATGNILLVGAAAALGLQWGYLRRRTGSLVPCIVSHAVWDLIVFVLYPALF